ncbi:MAG TPA: hypothetical protein VGO06_14285 [Bosea sp. (in: a-proteobacteria)]|jgi:hypothetical protein|uniref:hypothetical protein n=1 Tax=Bosea sp. (in: a-proteobacteria) TaxID=1871050 RepID=UPI002E0DC238|nr:hypothetical protein [Bosea sp. (in: a-proteobacteria)]
MTVTCFQAPADPNDAAGRRAILELLRAADNDNETDPRQAHSDRPRHRTWQEEFQALLIWRRLRDASEADACGSTWLKAAGDPDAPTNAEASKPLDWTEDDLIMAASLGVRWKQVGGRLVPADGQLEYGPTGRLIRCGALILADDLVAANDDDPKPQPANDAAQVEIIGGIRRPTEREDEPDDPEDVAPSIADIMGRVLHPSDDINRGRRDGARVRGGSIIGILHRKKNSDKVIVRTEPRNPAGRFRPRKGKLPPPRVIESPNDVVDAKHRLGRILSKLSGDTAMVLDFALRAANFSEIGEVFGKSGKNAERVGKQKLIDACAEFENSMKQCAEEDATRQRDLAA